MRHEFRTIVLTGLLAAAGIGSALAQTTPPPAPQTAPSANPQGGPGRMDPARREARMQKHFAEMKAKLRITAEQEGNWNTFVASMRPPEGGMKGQRPDRAEFDKLTTPQRIDKMREMRARHQAEADRRGDSIKTFYATLTPAQQQTFDALPQPHFGHHGQEGRGSHGGPRGPGGMGPRGDAPAAAVPAPAR
jgi:protein CpxP